MFVGHLGVGLAAKRMAPRLSLGVLFLAAMLLDALLWIFVLLAGPPRCRSVTRGGASQRRRTTARRCAIVRARPRTVSSTHGHE